MAPHHAVTTAPLALWHCTGGSGAAVRRTAHWQCRCHCQWHSLRLGTLALSGTDCQTASVTATDCTADCSPSGSSQSLSDCQLPSPVSMHCQWHSRTKRTFGPPPASPPPDWHSGTADSPGSLAGAGPAIARRTPSPLPVAGSGQWHCGHWLAGGHTRDPHRLFQPPSTANVHWHCGSGRLAG